jgi:hypothetical protein
MRVTEGIADAIFSIPTRRMCCHCVLLRSLSASFLLTARHHAGAVLFGHLGARSSNSAANHVPNQPIDALIPRDDFGTQAGVYA